MIVVDKFYGKKIGVIGLGKTGIAAIKSLLAGGATVIVWDDNHNAIKALQATDEDYISHAINEGRLVLSPAPEAYITLLSGLLVSPGVSITPPKAHPIAHMCIQHGIPNISDFDLLAYSCPKAKYIGITGTNGKSTTTALIGHIFHTLRKEVEVGGNIGTSVLSLRSLTEEGSYVLETSSFQIERLHDIKFHVAILLNITPDHQDRYNGFEEYAQTKANIFNYLTADGKAIICIDCPISRQIYSSLKEDDKTNLVPISTQQKLIDGVSLIDGIISVSMGGMSKEYNIGLPHYLPGDHNSQNILAAFTAAIINGLNPKEVIDAILSFKGLEHRMQLIAEIGEVKFVNDSKATNADACAKALQTYDDIYWIAGGVCKDNGIIDLKHLFPKVKHAYLIGKAAEQFAAVLADHNIPHTKAETLEKAMVILKQSNLHHGVVLLSPACASLDQWKNFEERGNAFCHMVKNFQPLTHAI